MFTLSQRQGIQLSYTYIYLDVPTARSKRQLETDYDVKPLDPEQWKRDPLLRNTKVTKANYVSYEKDDLMMLMKNFVDKKISQASRWITYERGLTKFHPEQLVSHEDQITDTGDAQVEAITAIQSSQLVPVRRRVPPREKFNNTYYLRCQLFLDGKVYPQSLRFEPGVTRPTSRLSVQGASIEPVLKCTLRMDENDLDQIPGGVEAEKQKVYEQDIVASHTSGAVKKWSAVQARNAALECSLSDNGEQPSAYDFKLGPITTVTHPKSGRRTYYAHLDFDTRRPAIASGLDWRQPHWKSKTATVSEAFVESRTNLHFTSTSTGGTNHPVTKIQLIRKT